MRPSLALASLQTLCTCMYVNAMDGITGIAAMRAAKQTTARVQSGCSAPPLAQWLLLLLLLPVPCHLSSLPLPFSYVFYPPPTTQVTLHNARPPTGWAGHGRRSELQSLFCTWDMSSCALASRSEMTAWPSGCEQVNVNVRMHGHSTQSVPYKTRMGEGGSRNQGLTRLDPIARPLLTTCPPCAANLPSFHSASTAVSFSRSFPRSASCRGVLLCCGGEWHVDGHVVEWASSKDGTTPTPPNPPSRQPRHEQSTRTTLTLRFSLRSRPSRRMMAFSVSTSCVYVCGFEF
jgi:hypothetical protein